MIGRRLRVLVVPEQYPRSAVDIGGIFAHDYVRAIIEKCKVHVLVASSLDEIGLRQVSDSVAGETTWTYSTLISKLPLITPRLKKLSLLLSLGRIADQLPPIDLIHAHGPVYHGHAAMRLGKRLGVPVLVTVHTGPFSKLMKSRLVKRIVNSTLSRVDCVLPVSEDLRNQILEFGIGPKRMEVLYNPVNTDVFKPNNTKRQNVIVWAGRLEQYKGAFRTVRAFHRVVENHPSWRLEIIGDGPEFDVIASYLKDYPLLASRVTLHGMLTKKQIGDIYTRVSFGAFPTEHETFGLVLVEALASGLPVIAPNCTAPPEYVGCTNGILIPPSDVDAIALAMKKMIKNIDQYDRRGIRDDVVRRFGIPAFGRKLQELYLDICDCDRYEKSNFGGA